MATLREVRSRIGGVKKTQKITRAMKMVAAAKLRRRQNAVTAARPYARAMKDLLERLSGFATGIELMTPREVKSVAIVIVSSDRGFCGAFNSNIMKAAVAQAAALRAGQPGGPALKLFCIGKKGVDFFGKRGYTLVGRHIGIYGSMKFGTAQQIAREIIEGYQQGAYDRVDLVFNEFKTVAQQRVVVDQFLPIPVPVSTGGKRPATGNEIFEPGEQQILEALVPRHLNFMIWRALLESSASEEGARMAAMENATENAREMIETLQLQYNKARQAAITKELLEIVGGAEALTKAS
jgi:F-type H+-transporting ATPase subunit gamma